MLVTMKDMLKEAQRGGYAVPAFNVSDIESIRAVVAAAEEQKSPVIVAVYCGLFDEYMPADYYGSAGRIAAERVEVPVALHLDHGRNIGYVIQALRSGFSSVMIDGSHLPYQENVDITKRVADAAHSVGVSVEGEIGVMASGESMPSEEEMSSLYTDPTVAASFAEETGVDALAVSIGTAHGKYARTPKLDIERLKAIRAATDVPLVMHGGSDTPEEDVKHAIQNGITKINIGTNYFLAYTRSLVNHLAAAEGRDITPMELFMRSRKDLVGFCSDIIQRFRQAHK
jgi:ketose-bisphosphate aldolase